MRVTKVGDDSQISIILIPGGPGLSTSYLRSMDELSGKYQLHFLDICGTNGTQFECLSALSIAQTIKEYAENIESPFVLLGHSYGGYLASKTATITLPEALICVSTPLSASSMKCAIGNYSSKKSLNLIAREAEWLRHNSEETFKSWLSSYGKLYFKNNDDRLSNLILNDESSYRFFLNNNGDIENDSSLLVQVAKTNFPKLFISGIDDELLPLSAIKSDIEAGSFDFTLVNNAGHFPMLDNLKSTLSYIDNFISSITSQRTKK